MANTVHVAFNLGRRSHICNEAALHTASWRGQWWPVLYLSSTCQPIKSIYWSGIICVVPYVNGILLCYEYFHLLGAPRTTPKHFRIIEDSFKIFTCIPSHTWAIIRTLRTYRRLFTNAIKIILTFTKRTHRSSWCKMCLKVLSRIKRLVHTHNVRSA